MEEDWRLLSNRSLAGFNSMDILDVNAELISSFVKEGKSYKYISEVLRHSHPNCRGLSERSVRRYCNEHHIRFRSGLNEEELTGAVCQAVSEVSTLT